jgi:hypothetical protein
MSRFRKIEMSGFSCARFVAEEIPESGWSGCSAGRDSAWQRAAEFASPSHVRNERTDGSHVDASASYPK